MTKTFCFYLENSSCHSKPVWLSSLLGLIDFSLGY